jgi:hypothetical protein
MNEELVEIVRELESQGETDLEAFRKLLTEWTVSRRKDERSPS